MAILSRLDPFNEMTRLDPFGDIDLFKGFMLRPVFQGAQASAPQMRVEVLEDDKIYTIRAEIPGVSKDDINIAVDGNKVSISAEVRNGAERKDGKSPIYSERYYGQVARTLNLDKEVDLSAAKARYLDGILEAELPKKQGATARQITVS